MKRTLKKLLSLVLVATLFISSIPTQAFAAEETEVYLPEVALGEDILAHDVFYLATTGASIPENGNGVYLLRVGRGGPADSESSVLVKIADMTAKYGEDYIVRVRDERTRVENPEDNFSLMEMMEDSDFEQRAISDSDEFADMLENDAEAQEAYREGVNAALTYLEDASGLSEKYDGENPYAEAESGEDAEPAGEAEPAEGETSDAEPVEGESDESAGDAEPAEGESDESAGEAEPTEEEDGEPAEGETSDAEPVEGESDEPAGEAEPAEEEDGEPAGGETTEPAGALDVAIEAVPAWDAGAIPADGSGELLTIGGGEETEDSLQKAVNLFTGRNATPQRLTSEGDMFQDLQAIANVMTNAVVGASVELSFAEGETEKYLEIVPKDNRTGDGDRMFYIILGAPGGTTTNSSASTCAFTIVDDEEQEPATVSFSDAVYYADGESITVTVNRSGAMNTVVSARVKTTGEGTAQAGRDYAEVDAELVFPFGVDHLTLDIPVRTAYLTGEGSFGLALEPTAGCETGETAAATVYLEGSYTGKASLMAAQSASPAEGELMAVSGTTTDRNNLATLKTLDNIDLSKPVKTYYTGMQSVNRYNSAGQWQMMYAHKDSAGKWGGKVESFFELTDDYWTSYFLSGAQVKWNRTYGGSDHALMRVALFGSRQTPNKTYPLASGRASSLSENTLFDAQLTEEVETELFGWPNWSFDHAVKWFPYSSDRDFTNETRYIYPSLAASDPSKQGRYATPEGSDIYAVRDAYWTALQNSAPTEPEFPQLTDLGGPALGGDHPQAIGFLNWGQCKDCNILYISSVAPVLRPFQVNVRDGDRLSYLLEDGSRGTISSDTSVYATLAEGGRQAVLFMDDSFTVNTISGSNVGQYAYITGLNLLDGKDESKVLYTLATNNDPANTSITYTLSTGNMEQMIKTICPEYGNGETQNWFNLLRENTQVNEGQNKDGYATYALYNIKPTFDYVGTSVTLRNPYNFPVTMVISGTQYKLNAREVRKINTPDGQSWHRGDTMAVSRIILSEDLLKSYTPVGVRYESKFRTTDALPNKGTLSFVAGNAVYVSGGIDGRLNYAEVIVEPNIQAKDNKIQVRVKNTELSKFLSDDDVKIVETPVLDEQGKPVLDENGKPLIDREVETLGVAGVLGTKGRVDGDYTVFTYADTDKTVNGQLYAITATPKDSGMVCVWEDNNTLKTYEGNTFYFTAGEELARNQITLSAAPATAEVTLQGTLKYTSFNLRAGLAGIESNLPAAGAILAAGSAGGVANKDGYVTAGPIPYSGNSEHYLRYLVSVNGTDLVQETPLPGSSQTITPPTLLWDFDDTTMTRMGANAINSLSIRDIKTDRNNNIYRFTNMTYTNADPCVSFDDAAVSDADDIKWVKIRARNLSAEPKLELFAAINGTEMGDTNVQIGLYTDTQWHEYIVNVQTANAQLKGSNHWKGKVDWIRLDPMAGEDGAGVKYFSQIEFDYIAFFPNQASALAFRPAPTLLWDFDSENTMSANMGAQLNSALEYSGEEDADGSDYYTFTATGANPFVSIDNAAVSDAETLRWVKIRARNLSAEPKMELFAGRNGAVADNTCVQIDLHTDTLWHEYIVDMQELNRQLKGGNHWTGRVDWIRLDPMEGEGGVKNRSQIDIDYIAFFSDEANAKAFRSGGYEPAASFPTVVWNFNSQNTMRSSMGAQANSALDFNGEKDADGNEYFTFTAKGADPYVSVDNVAGYEAASFQWMKIRARNLSGQPKMELFAAINGTAMGDTNVQIPLNTDTQWHEYLVDIHELNRQLKGSNHWTKQINWIRLDPMAGEDGAGVKNGDQIQIDYIAFFSDKASAKAFINSGNSGEDPSAPTLLWDFNSDNAMNANMRYNGDGADLSYIGGTDGIGNDYYTFTATASGGQPSVVMDNLALHNADTVQWVKIRARNLSGAKAMRINAYTYDTSANAQIDLETDTRWHEYIVNAKESSMQMYLSDYWAGAIDWIVFYPMWTYDGVKSGDKIQIDYIAFFPSEASAKAFRTGGDSGEEPIRLTMLWDFNSDNAMSANMGGNVRDFVDYNGEKDADGNDYYTFSATASGRVPYVSIDNVPVSSADDIRWVKIRARNLSGQRRLQMRAMIPSSSGNTDVQIDLNTDTQWHEYIVDIQELSKQKYGSNQWTGQIDWFILTPTVSNSGYVWRDDQIQIDFIAFFPDEDSAKAFTNNGDVIAGGDDDNEPGVSTINMLWDFNSDNAMSANMGWNDNNHLSYVGEKDADGNDYYTFTASGAWPSVSIDNSAVSDAKDIQWVKIRARNLSGAMKLGLFARRPIYTSANPNVQIDLNTDTQWHEYIANIQELSKQVNGGSNYWTDTIDFISLQLMKDFMVGGEQIQIDYIAFFPNKASAEAFRSGGDGGDSGDGGKKPTLLCDFNFDNAAAENIGMYSDRGLRCTAEKNSYGYDYYTFTNQSGIFRLPIYSAAGCSATDFRWVKIRAKNVNCPDETGIRLDTTIDDWRKSSVTIPLYADYSWHDYIYRIDASNWYNQIDSVTFTPMLGPQGPVNPDSQVQIDYIAFFPDEDSAKAFRNGNAETGDTSSDSPGGVSPDTSSDSPSGVSPDTSSDSTEIVVEDFTIDISSNFPTGVSPVTSSIFKDIQIEGELNDSAYQIDGSTIPVVAGMTANMTVRVRAQKYVFSMTGQDGQDLDIISDDLVENPVSVQLVVYDKNDVFRGEYELVDKFSKEGGYFVFDTPMEFVEPEELILLVDKDNKPVLDAAGNPVYVKMGEDGKPLLDENGKPIPAEPTYGLIPEPGDKLYLRLTTDRLAQVDELRTKSDQVIDEYRYSDVFTGLTFRQPLSYAAPPVMGLTEPIEIEYGNLPLVGNTGMDLAFPFVSVGIMKIYQGYRVYIGVSPVQIADTIKGSHMSSMSGAGGQYWKDLFSIKHPFDTFFGGMSEAATQIGEIRDAAKAAKANKQSYSAADLGSPSWKFDISVGMYFDFTYCTIKQGQSVEAYYRFDGLGGYVSVTLGFSMAWYVILPVVFLPAYFGIELGGTVMGFLGADFNSKVDVDYDASMNGSVNINDGITSLNGCIRGSAYVQISLGVGLCGTLGVRGSGKVNMIANWEPTDPNGSWGFYVGIQAGLIIDLFLFSIPLMYSFPGWPFGSFEYYSNPEKHTLQSASLMGAQDNVLMLREGSGEDSVWLGDTAELMGAFAPNRDKTQILAENAYERPDSQLITLSDGETLALAFIDSDNSKGVTQRTTLKMATYANGQWSNTVIVSNDNTADFQPSIAETKDGKLLVAWVSPTNTAVDLSTDDGVMQYLNSMEVYAAFIELDGSKQIKATNGVADTTVTRVSNDKRVNASGNVGYYDSNPTVVCDMESGDAMVYYIKSGRSALGDGKITDYINPYTNDCVVCYLPFNAAEDTDTDGRTVPAGWLFGNFYYSEMHGDTTNEQFLIDNFGGQRFLDGAVNANNERYTIPDFTAIGYNGLAVYAYTVDTDGSNNTDADKELYLQVYDFRNHETKYRIQLTDDGVSDTMPQFFRSKVNSEDGYSTDAENTHTKLFWYRDGKQVVYIDVTELLRNGINDDGTLKTETNGGEAETEYTYVLDGKTHYRYTDPRSVWFVSDTDSHASLSQPDFKAVEDSRGNLYILWTEGVTGEDGNAAQEIFGTGLVGHEITTTDGDGNAVTEWASSGWSRPYQITRDGWHNDEITVAMSGENLITVHNRFREELVELPEGKEYTGQVDFMPLTISDMCLVADTLEPCGSVETERITLYRTENGQRTETTRPVGGETVSIEVEVANNGMNTAEGYKLSLYAGDAPVSEIEVTDALAPSSTALHTFDYTLPANVDGLTFKLVAQEMRDAKTKTYYGDTDTYTSDPLKAEAAYVISDVETYQAADGFHARFTVSNDGNAASGSGDQLNIQLWGPANLANAYPDDQGSLHNEKISLGVGETKEFDVSVSVTPEMIREYGFVRARVAVQKEVVEQVINGNAYKGTRYLSNLRYTDFDLVKPMNMELANVSVEVESTADISLSMDLGDTFRGGDRVTYALEDSSIARLQGDKVLGVSEGTTKLYATHAATGATVASTVTVTKSGAPTPTYSSNAPSTAEITVEVSSDEGSVSVTAKVSGNTATVTVPTEAQMEQLIGRSKDTGAVTIDLSSLPKTVTSVTVPAGTIKGIDEAMEDSGEGLTVRLPGSTVTFDPEALASIAEQTTGKDLKLNMDPTTESKLNTKQKEALGDLDVQAVYDIYLTSNSKRITDFGGGKATVEVTYKLKDGQQPGGIEVWYVAGEGGKTWIPTTATADSVTFTVTHFSNYVLTYDETLPGACAKDDDCPMTPFTDLDKGSWYHDGVHWALENEVMSGYGGGKFGPDDSTSRAMMAQILWNMEGKPVVNFAMDYTDVAADAWYAEAVRWATAQGIMAGYGQNKFGPNDDMTREQLATILYRYAKLKGQGFTGMWAFPLNFDDASDVSGWANEAMCWMTMNGVIQGTGDNKLSPKGNATRAQVATMLMRYTSIEQ